MDQGDVDLKEIVAILKRQCKLIAMTVVLMAGVAFVYILAATPVYRATALVQVDAQGSNLLDPNAAYQQQSAVLNSRLDSEVEVLKSSSMALAVVEAGALIASPDFGPQLGWLEKLGLGIGVDLSPEANRRRLGLGTQQQVDTAALVNATLTKLQDALDIHRQGLTYLIAISVSSPSPTRSAEIANLYAKTYIEAQVTSKTASLLGARDVLQRQLATAQKDLSSSETAVNAFIEANLTRLEKESGDPAIAQSRRQLEAAKADQAAVAAKISTAQTAMSAKDWGVVTQTLGDAALAELDRQRVETTQKLDRARAGTAEALDLAAELARVESSLASTSTVSLAAAQTEVLDLGKREASARDQLRSGLLQSDLSAEMLTELFNLQQSATLARNQYQTLLARKQDLATLANLQISDARIVSAALAPGDPAAPRKKMILIMAAISGLGFGLMLAFLKEYYFGGVVSASQLQNIMQVRVPVTVPKAPPPESGHCADLVIAAPMSPYSESFRKLRASIDMGAELDGILRDEALVVLVCSALQAEGKTTSAISLARTYALSGANTLLIDADLRKPNVERTTGCRSEVGFLDYLMAWGSPEGLMPAAAHDPLSPLVILTAGERSAIPTDQLINSKAFHLLVNNLKKEFDIIIIDSPPLLPVVDTRYLVRHADVVVQVVRYVSTTQGEVREAATQIQEMLRPDAKLYGILTQEEQGARRTSYYGRHEVYYGQQDG